MKYNNTLKFRYDLSYENRDRRRFLNEVILNDGSKYTFTYEHSNGSYPLPTQGPNGKSDIYGFWKKDNASAGLMKFVYYPTGGYSEFQYEKHQFSKEVRFDAMKNKKYLIEVGNHGNDNTGNNPGSGGNPETETFQDPIHKDSTHMCDGNRVASSSRHNGSRIKKVVHYTADNEKASEKEYIYNTQIEGNTSSGILYQSLPFIGVNIVTGADIYASGSIIWLNNYNIDEPAIGYSNVFERYSDSSYCKYSFYDWNDNPDSLGNDDVKFKFINETTDTIKYNDLSLVLTGHSRVASYSDHRGRLKDKFYYASGSTTSELTEYFDYLNMKRPETDAISDPIQKKHEEPESQREYVVAFLSMEGGGMAKKIYLDKYHPVTRHEVINKDGIRTIYETSYNDCDLPKIENTVIMDSGDTLRNNFYYPFDYTGAPYSSMVSRNRISPIIEQVKQRIRNGNSNEIERLKTDYTAVKDNLFLPANKQSSVGGNPLKEVMSYDKYDDKGNILQTTGVDGIKTAYKWSDDGLYLLAEVWNATYDEIKNISVYDLRNQFSGAQVTTYTYKPLVGMTSKTDPRGITTYYEYDAFGRLKYIKDNQQNIIERYEYHYKPQ